MTLWTSHFLFVRTFSALCFDFFVIHYKTPLEYTVIISFEQIGASVFSVLKMILYLQYQFLNTNPTLTNIPHFHCDFELFYAISFPLLIDKTIIEKFVKCFCIWLNWFIGGYSCLRCMAV